MASFLRIPGSLSWLSSCKSNYSMARGKLSNLLFDPSPPPNLQKYLMPGAIPFQEARLCLDCEVVCQTSRCPKCAGRSVHPLATWLKTMPPPLLRLERRRSGTDRRKGPDPNYHGPERRKGERRKSR